MPSDTQPLRRALSEALVLADGEAIEAASVLIEAVAEYLGLDPASLRIGEPLAA
jgi:hypothetical protein